MLYTIYTVKQERSVADRVERGERVEWAGRIYTLYTIYTVKRDGVCVDRVERGERVEGADLHALHDLHG